jgi:hypothetical protein
VELNTIFREISVSPMTSTEFLEIELENTLENKRFKTPFSQGV